MNRSRSQILPRHNGYLWPLIAAAAGSLKVHTAMLFTDLSVNRPQRDGWHPTHP